MNHRFPLQCVRTMSHYPQSNRERVIALIESGARNISNADAEYNVSAFTASRWWRSYQRTGEVGRRPRPICTGRVSTAEQDAMVVEFCEKEHFLSSDKLRHESGFPGSFRTVRRSLGEVRNKSYPAAVREDLRVSHRFHRLEYTSTNENRRWDCFLYGREEILISKRRAETSIPKKRRTICRGQSESLR